MSGFAAEAEGIRHPRATTAWRPSRARARCGAVFRAGIQARGAGTWPGADRKPSLGAGRGAAESGAHLMLFWWTFRWLGCVRRPMTE